MCGKCDDTGVIKREVKNFNNETQEIETHSWAGICFDCNIRLMNVRKRINEQELTNKN